MFLVEKIMTQEVVTVNAKTDIISAMHIMVDAQVSGLPVVDGGLRLVGILSEKDVLGLLMRKNISSDKTVAEFMTREVHTFAPTDSAVDVCEFLLENPYRRVPIVDKGKLVGIVARRDIINLILKVRGKKR